jgi:hypothetical protein
MSCLRTSDNTPVYVIVALNWDGETVGTAPFGEMCAGDPYEDYIPPVPVTEDSSLIASVIEPKN